MVKNPVLLVLVVAALAAAIVLPFLSHAPNRLLSGEPVPWGVVLEGWRSLAFAPAIVLLVGPFLPDGRITHALVALAASALIAGMIWLAGDVARSMADAATPAARTSFGGAFWILAVMAALAASDALQKLTREPALRIGLALLLAVPAVVLVADGFIDALSIMKEYANRRAVFAAAVTTHLAIIAAMLVPTLAIGLPLGLLVHRRQKLGRPIFAVLNIIQTVPSIALFGLLIAPLAALVAFAPALARLGISGIGVTPAIIALTLYSLLPIVRSTAAGLAAVPTAAIEAARGIGMTRGQIFRAVEVPLALPVLVAGLRVTVVQAVGLTAVAALIGAGGLGAIIFQGLNASAIDLVMLGVVPLVGIAVLADLALKLAGAMLKARTG